MQNDSWKPKVKKFLEAKGIPNIYSDKDKLYSPNYVSILNQRESLIHDAEAEGLELGVQIFEFKKPPKNRYFKGPGVIFYPDPTYCVTWDDKEIYRVKIEMKTE